MTTAGDGSGHRVLSVESLPPRTRYRLLTSLIVPRPIGWISTVSEDGVANLAPFSYFGALASSPMMVGVSIGLRPDGRPKDSLANIRSSGAFCANVVTVRQLEAMNTTSASLPPETSEFEVGRVDLGWSEAVRAPFVRDCPAVLECMLWRELALGDAPNVLVIGEVVGLRLEEALFQEPGSDRMRPGALDAVGRLGGADYALPGEIRRLDRP